jgi:hypothetical protein
MSKQEESPVSNLLSNLPQLAAVVAAFVGLVVVKPKLESPRPTPAAPKPLHRRWDNSVPARLWQDPLAGFLDEAQNDLLPRVRLCKVIKDMPAVEDSLTTRDCTRGLKNAGVLFLFVYVGSTSDAAASEGRRRERYATLSALNTAGYAPVNSDRLSYFSPPEAKHEAKKQGKVAKPAKASFLHWKPGWTDPATPTQPAKKDPAAVIPYEWAQAYEPWNNSNNKSSECQYQSVCVMWIKEKLPKGELRFDSNMEFFSNLQQELEKELGGKTKARFAVTGSISSTHLLEFLRESKHLKVESEAKLPAIPFYITKSTAPRVREIVQACSGFQAHFLIRTDRVLAECLVKELEIRGLKPGTRGNSIAIVSEWDTEYGRSMFPVFDAAIRKNASEGPGEEDDYWVKQYSYLAGLDGKLPGDAKPAEVTNHPTETEATGPAGKDRDLPAADKAEGDSQVDYLRRLVGRMKADQKTFRAIGVVGNDVYDKLLILKALRPSFPEALFFTTDLDVRLLQPAELPYTRNLIVASHYGLSLNQDLQKSIAPFRSGYDTATYIGCLKAVGFKEIDKIVFSNLDAPQKEAQACSLPTVFWKRNNTSEETLEEIPPRLYEVGRTDAYELTFYENDPLYGKTPRQDPWLFQKCQLWFLQLNRLWVIILSLVCLAALLMPISKPWRDFVFHPFGLGAVDKPGGQPVPGATKKSHSSVSWLWLGLVLAVVLAILMAVAHFMPDEEPVGLVTGISVWPTAALRLLAIVLCLCFLADALEKLRERNKEIDRELNPKGRAREPDQGDKRASFFRRLGKWTKELFSPWFWKKAFYMWCWKPKGPGLYQVWMQAKRHAAKPRRVARCIVLTLLYGGLLFSLDQLVDPPMPQARGDLARTVFWILFFGSEASLAFLLLFVMDCTFLCYRFVTFLESAEEKQWPKEALELVAKQRGFTMNEHGEEKMALEQYLRIKLVDLVTKEVARFLYAPFTVMLVLLVAHSWLFEDWHWNIPLIITTLVNAATALGCAWMLQRTAKHARERALEALDTVIVPRVGSEGESYKKLQRIKKDITDLQSGAFGSFLQNPVIKAVLIPLGGTGALATITALMTYL